MTRRLLPAVALVAVLSLVAASPAAGDRFDGYVAGVGSGKGRHFIVGNGLNLVFVDRQRSFTPYRVCWHRLHTKRHRCWLGETGRRGRKDRIFTAAPSSVGTYLLKWTVRKRRKAFWRFYNGPGD